MPCFSPLTAYRARETNPTGKRSLVFNPRDGYRDLQVQIACGQCVGCRLETSRQWAMRCMHEAQLYECNSYVTLTYRDEALPETGSLVKKDFQDFMKRLRHHRPPRSVRYYMCGEYGDENGRPHYHACLFNVEFPDMVKVGTNRHGQPLYASGELAEIWPHGFNTIGSVTFESAAYVARYVMKKITGEKAADHYWSVDPETGEAHQVIPEYTEMSRRPGIGAHWYQRFKTDAYPSDFLIVNGKRVKPPQYYDDLYGLENPEALKSLKAKRLHDANQHRDNQTPERLRVRETVKRAAIKSLKRNL